MFALLKTRTIADIRSGIGTSRDRLAVLLQFDLEILRRGGPLSPFLRIILLNCLRNGWPREKILKRYGVGRGVVQRLSREIDRKHRAIVMLLKQGRTNLEIRKATGASNALVKRLRAAFLGDASDLRFISREKHNAIVAAISSGKTRNSICREFRCSSGTVQRIRGGLHGRSTAG
jgi:uncharacterized protein YerC